MNFKKEDKHHLKAIDTSTYDFHINVRPVHLKLLIYACKNTKLNELCCMWMDAKSRMRKSREIKKNQKGIREELTCMLGWIERK